MSRHRFSPPVVATTAEEPVRMLAGTDTQSEIRFGASPTRRADGPNEHTVTAAEPTADPASSRTLRARTSRLRRIAADLLVVALIAVAAVAIWPVRLGGATSYIIIKGTSMEPKFHTGDLAVLRKQDSYRKGDIVAYRIPAGGAGAGHLVIHRIIGRSRGGYLLQGDNRTTPDTWYPKTSDVLGKFRILVPLLGMQFWVLIPWICCAAIGIAVMWILWPRRAEADPTTELEDADSRGSLVGVALIGAGGNAPVPVGERRLRRLEQDAQAREQQRRRPRRFRPTLRPENAR